MIELHLFLLTIPKENNNLLYYTVLHRQTDQDSFRFHLFVVLQLKVIGVKQNNIFIIISSCDTFVVRFGLTNLTRPEHIVESTLKHIHPEYIEIIAGVQRDDIALIEFTRPIPFSGKNLYKCPFLNVDPLFVI